jgi:hypothetical protein
VPYSHGHETGEKAAYFASVNATRTDLALESVSTIPVLHDEGKLASGFTSVLYNLDQHDQLRYVGSIRFDRNQVPNIVEQQANGIDDHANTTDGVSNFIRTRARLVFRYAISSITDRAAF